MTFRLCRVKLPVLSSGAFLTIVLCVVIRVMQSVTAASPVRTVLVHGNSDYLLVPDVLTFLFSIHGIGLSCGYFWTPLTYMFLHGSWMHLILNMIGVAVFGGAIEEAFGRWAYWTVFLSGGILGGVGWVLSNGLSSIVPCVGASAGVFALAGAFAAVSPYAEMIVFMPFPIKMRAWIMAFVMMAANALELVFVSGSNVAYLAHLVGILFGVVCGLLLRSFCRRREHAGSGKLV